jgi:hypothetical protein
MLAMLEAVMISLPVESTTSAQIVYVSFSVGEKVSKLFNEEFNSISLFTK